MNWQRVESSTIDPAVVDGLAARIADPLWLLARQWQVGEFRGEDAANPLLVRLRAQSVEVDEWRPGPSDGDGALRPTDAGQATPLEALVEAEPVAGQPGSVRLGAEAAHLLVGMLRTELAAPVLTSVVAGLRTRYPITLPNSRDRRDRAGERRLAVLAAHSFDALALASELAGLMADRTSASREMAALATGLIAGGPQSAVTTLATVLERWAVSLLSVFVLPNVNETWNPERMEYEFQLGAQTGGSPVGSALAARDYGGGRLDWYSFDLGDHYPRTRVGEVTTYEREMLPTALRYAGMPASRFWEMEDGGVYFGDVDAAPEDLARVTLAAYAAVYGDDWLMVPLTVAAGSIVQVTQLVVLDDFGGTTPIGSAAVLDGPDRVFKYFELTGDPAPSSGGAPVLFLPPTVATTDSGRPLDDVSLARDESANLAWAIERRVEGSYGRGVDPLASKAGIGPYAAPPPTATDVWTFDLGGDVPGNWVPLFPVRLGQGGAIGLQRGRVPVPGTRRTRGALSTLLEPDRRLIVEESEVPDAGLRVIRRFQSARTRTGGLRVWLGRQKGPGRPSPDSGFVTDRLLRSGVEPLIQPGE